MPRMSFSFAVSGLPMSNTHANRKLKICTIFGFPKNKLPAKTQSKSIVFFSKKTQYVSISSGTSVTHDLNDGGGGLARMTRVKTF